MSLEIALQENTKAIYALMEHMKTNVAHATPITIQPATTPSVTRPELSTVQAVKPTQMAETKTEQPATEQPATKTNTTPVATHSYDDAAKAVTNLAAKKGKSAAVQLLAKFGAKKLPEVKPDDFAELIADAHQIMEQDIAA